MLAPPLWAGHVTPPPQQSSPSRWRRSRRASPQPEPELEPEPEPALEAAVVEHAQNLQELSGIQHGLAEWNSSYAAPKYDSLAAEACAATAEALRQLGAAAARAADEEPADAGGEGSSPAALAAPTAPAPKPRGDAALGSMRGGLRDGKLLARLGGGAQAVAARREAAAESEPVVEIGSANAWVEERLGDALRDAMADAAQHRGAAAQIRVAARSLRLRAQDVESRTLQPEPEPQPQPPDAGRGGASRGGDDFVTTLSSAIHAVFRADAQRPLTMLASLLETEAHEDEEQEEQEGQEDDDALSDSSIDSQELETSLLEHRRSTSPLNPPPHDDDDGDEEGT